MDKKAFTKNCLATALIELLEVKEYSDISIQDIVDKAGFSRMAYYRNFRNTDEILDYYLSTHTETFLKSGHIDLATLGIRGYFDAIFEKISNEGAKKFIQLLFNRGLIIYLYKAFITYIYPEMDEEKTYYSRFIAGGVFSICMRWLKMGCKETPKELTGIVMKFLPDTMKA